MAGYKNCRGAKTAEEYLLKCLLPQRKKETRLFFMPSL